jgi:hypothetical protein
MIRRNVGAVRPETALEAFGPRFGEYPQRLLTRRTYSLHADEVLERRETAPNPVWCDRRTRPDGGGQQPM